MTTLREAAQFALEALEDIFGKNKVDVGAINALRKALADNRSAEPEAWLYERQEWCGYQPPGTRWLSVLAPDAFSGVAVGAIKASPLYANPQPKGFEEVAEQLVAAEREACAMLAYSYPAPDPGGSWRESIASAIRARGASDRHP